MKRSRFLFYYAGILVVLSIAAFALPRTPETPPKYLFIKGVVELVWGFFAVMVPSALLIQAGLSSDSPSRKKAAFAIATVVGVGIITFFMLLPGI